MAIKILCDVCGKEPNDYDFACDIKIIEIMTSLKGESLAPLKEKRQEIYQICKGCFYSHLSNLFKNAKKNN